jgi:CMP-N,N'-diacetyllegionaminic acid synthase
MPTKNVVALLTGRGNNTLPDKNIIPVAGRPLLHYPAMAARQVQTISHFYVSSDCPKILKAAGDVGYSPIVRPPHLGAPDAKHVDVIDHALEEFKNAGIIPDILVVLLANHVTIKSEWIADCIDKLLEQPNLTACVPVYQEMDHHPFRAKTLDADGKLTPFFDFEGKPISSNRQELPPCYFLAHNFWVLNLKTIDRAIGQPPWNFMGHQVAPYVVDEAFDIHNIADVARSEQWLTKNNII